MLCRFDAHGQGGPEAQTGAPAPGLQPAAAGPGLSAGQPPGGRPHPGLREALRVPDQSV